MTGPLDRLRLGLTDDVDGSRALDVLTAWESDAERGKDARFRGWTFFDTNCLSDLVKLASAGEADRVNRFVEGRDVIIPITVFQELRRAPQIAQQVPDVLATATVYGAPHPTAFWECDIWSFLNPTGIPRNVLGAYPLTSGEFADLYLSVPLQAGFERAERAARERFRAQVERDRTHNVDERTLVPLIWGKAAELMQKGYGIELHTADCRPENFPAIFTYQYMYYFRYLAQRKVIFDPNDFIDLAHTSIAPYCCAFYAERKMVQILRNQVKGRASPTPYGATKRLHATGYVDDSGLENARRSADTRRPTTSLLPHTEIATLAEMREAILAL